MIRKEITLVPIDSIRPYEKNAKKHPQKQVEQIANSIKAFGFNQPLVCNREHALIVGHGRYEAAKVLNLTEVPVLYVDDLTPEQIKAYRLADNKLNESDWDMDLVVDELKLLEPELIDLTGFSQDLILEPEEKDDDIPTEAPVRANLGDVWALGRHRLICGDSTKKEDVARLMGEQRADMVFTDPPYRVDYEGKTEDKLTIQNDGDARAFQEAMPLFSEFTKEGAAYYVCCPSGPNFTLFSEAFAQYGYLSQTIVWVKNSMVLGHSDYHYQHEPILYGWKNGAAHTFYGDRTWTTVWKHEPTDKEILKWAREQITTGFNGKTSIWQIDRPSVSREHPTMKPVALVEKAIINSSKSEDLILDLFLGSGSTLIAAEKTGRVCYGMEIEPKYVDVILKRWEEYTGQTAQKLE